MKQRKQVTSINTNNSDILELGSYSVAQGSILSGIFAMLFTLDIHKVSHSINHQNFNEYYQCENPKNLIYVDDVYTIVQTKNDDVWPEVRKFISNMENYFEGNKLVINVDKTQVMIIKNQTKNEKNTKKNIKDKNIKKIVKSTTIK